jgi:hypothetical protein
MTALFLEALEGEWMDIEASRQLPRFWIREAESRMTTAREGMTRRSGDGRR